MDTLADFVAKYGTKAGVVAFLLASISIPWFRSALSGFYQRLFPDATSLATAKKIAADTEDTASKTWQQLYKEVKTRLDTVEGQYDAIIEINRKLREENSDLREKIEHMQKALPQAIRDEITNQTP